jgi:serine/threonine-protein kinase
VEQGSPYLVMELLRGEAMAAYLGRAGRAMPDETAAILFQVAGALERMHALGIVHRDLKPDNLFLVDGPQLSTKIVDFGVARVGDQALLTTLTPGTCAGDLVGTPNYMSPEQLRDPQSLDHRSDVWALGVIAFECLLGRVPFRAQHLAGMIVSICSRPAPVPSLLGPVPYGFDAWFARACAKEPERRFQSAVQAATALQALCQPLRPPRSTRASSP